MRFEPPLPLSRSFLSLLGGADEENAGLRGVLPVCHALHLKPTQPARKRPFGRFEGQQ